MSRVFRPKTMRRVVLLLALAFPIVYLMVALAFALNGAHGNVNLSEDGMTFSQYLFSQPFVSDNFVSVLGRGVLNDDIGGFVPMATFFRFLDENLFGFGVSNDLAVFVYGYAYYVVNVVLLYEIVVIALKVLLIPLKMLESFDRRNE